MSLIVLMAALAGCRDDLLEIEEFGEGESRVAFDMEFEPMYTALDNSRAITEGGTPGDAINSINSLTVLCYKPNGTLYKVWRAHTINSTTGSGDFSYTLENNNDMPSDFNPADNEHQAEAQTPKAHFTIKGIPFGRYKFYAVANLDITDTEAKDIENIKKKSLTWNAGDIAANNAMFGFFSNDKKAGVRPQTFDADVVTIKDHDTNLWAWIKRTVSKVTVAFDARNLNQNITIYIKDVQIRDIPKECTLGMNNTPNAKEEIQDGASIVYSESQDYGPDFVAQISRGNPIYGAAGRVRTGADGKPLTPQQQIEMQHGETTPALYFFENMQGKGVKGTASDKRQDVNGENKSVSYPNGNDPNNEAFKDAKKYGTFIEVHAFYSKISSGGNSQGDIIYRFMLGQDDVIDYDAIRNRHYKLTLCFNGNANDVDWHIVYTEPEVNYPNPYYISYLYNHRMMCPVTVKTGKRTITKITARIISNNWAPMGAPKNSYWSNMDYPEDYPYNGFLSLKKTTETVIRKASPWGKDANKEYYDKNKRGIRVYEHFEPNNGVGYNDDGSIGEDGQILEEDRYYVDLKQDKDGNNVYNLSLPMYTRAKQMIKETGYTGNNPYVAYRRQAKVSLTIELNDGSTIQKLEPLEIWQMRRIVNPKGIFREWNSKRQFHVELKTLLGEESTSFTTLTSLTGPWKAYVVRASGNSASGTDKEGNKFGPSDGATTEDAHDMLYFSGGNSLSAAKDTVYGDTGSPIDFYINFRNHCSSNDKSRFAVVRVEYNNETCYHLIYVRQGSAPVRLLDNEAKWHVGNLIAKGVEATTPIDEGSLFKFGQIDWPIESRSNTNGGAAYVDGKRPWDNWNIIGPDDFLKNDGTNMYIYGKTDRTYNWGDIPEGNSYENALFNNHGVSGARIAEFDDYFALLDSDDIELGYGVMYGDAATGTGTTLEEVYGYYTGQPSTYGIRGAFVYNKTNGVSIFFPIGNSGYGHRKDTGKQSWAPYTNKWPNDDLAGLLRYCCNARWGEFDVSGGNYPNGTDSAPLFYDIYRRPGAIYWLGKAVKPHAGAFPYDDVTQGSVIAGWDINYFTFDFYPIATGNVGSGKDACFVRCVSD